MSLYTDPCTCPMCGMGSNNLIDTALPVVLRRFGKYVMLSCQICFHQWFVHREERVT